MSAQEKVPKEKGSPAALIGYADSLRQVLDALSQFPGLHLIGRSGSFRYLNIDGVIDQSLQLARELAEAP